MEKKVPSFHKMCASPCYYSGNRWLRNIQASTPPFTDVHGPHLHEGTSKTWRSIESLTENVSVCTIQNMCWSKYRVKPKKKKIIFHYSILWIILISHISIEYHYDHSLIKLGWEQYHGWFSKRFKVERNTFLYSTLYFWESFLSPKIWNKHFASKRETVSLN